MNPILIVDDEVEMRIAMSETLKHCGYPVELSHNANDALKKIAVIEELGQADQASAGRTKWVPRSCQIRDSPRPRPGW